MSLDLPRPNGDKTSMSYSEQRSTRPLIQTFLFPLASRFVAGDSITDVLTAVERLNEDGLSATIDVLGEDVNDAHDADATRDTYCALIEKLQRKGLKTNLSLKLSAFGLNLDDESAAGRFATVLERANVLADPFVRVDMEGFAMLPRTLETVVAAFRKFPNTGVVLQAYLHRTPGDVAAMIELGMRVRLCKGAYRQTADVAILQMPAIQKAYIACAEPLLEHGVYPAFATHDLFVVNEIRRLAAELNVPKTAFEFQMLFGVRPDLQRSLVRDGYNVRVYVPFGSHWAKYLLRRILERRENALFALRSAVGALWLRH